MTTFQAMLIFVYVTIGIWHTFKTFDPKTIGGIISCLFWGALIGTWVLCLYTVYKLLSLKVRK